MLEGILVLDLVVGEAGDLIENTQGIPHTAFAFLSDDLQGRFLSLHPFFLADLVQVLHRILDGDALEIENLASAQDGGQDLMFFRGGEDKNGIGRRLFKRLQKRVEGRGAEHVYLVNDIHFVFTSLGCETHLVRECADIFHRVVAGGIQLMDVHRRTCVKTHAALAGIAGLPIGLEVFAVDGFGEDPRTGGFAHTARTAEQESMRQLLIADGVFQRGGDMLLPHYG